MELESIKSDLEKVVFLTSRLQQAVAQRKSLQESSGVKQLDGQIKDLRGERKIYEERVKTWMQANGKEKAEVCTGDNTWEVTCRPKSYTKGWSCRDIEAALKKHLTDADAARIFELEFARPPESCVCTREKAPPRAQQG